MELTIRLAANDDIEGVVRVIQSVFDEYGFTWDEQDYHADLYDIETYYTAQGDSLFVALRDGEIVGTVGICRFVRTPGTDGTVTEVDGVIRISGCDCSLERLYVHPTARRQGLGRALVSHVLEIAKNEGRQVMEVWSDKRFIDAHRLYGAFGAQVVGDRICDDPDESLEWGLMIRIGS